MTALKQVVVTRWQQNKQTNKSMTGEKKMEQKQKKRWEYGVNKAVILIYVLSIFQAR